MLLHIGGNAESALLAPSKKTPVNRRFFRVFICRKPYYEHAKTCFDVRIFWAVDVKKLAFFYLLPNLAAIITATTA